MPRPNYRALPVTARSLETIIRIATAACKVRLSFTIDVEDVEVAKMILNHVLRKDVAEEEEEEEGAAQQEADGEQEA